MKCNNLYKTTIVFEVLTDEIAEDIIASGDLGAIVNETIHGHASGDIKSFETVEVTPAEMATLLIQQRSDPDFFVDVNL
tara:strand:+ start:6366 stop:6602 length:237 start_codon:yes stop_codon:yes gene_type:complete